MFGSNLSSEIYNITKCPQVKIVIKIIVLSPIVNYRSFPRALICCSAYQQDLIRELEPLRSHLRLAREECERKVQARWGEEQAEIGALKREKQQLQRDVEAMREKEKATQEVVHDTHTCNMVF